MIAVPDVALQYGFVNEAIGSLTSRTTMTPELDMVLSHCAADAGAEEYEYAVVKDNVLGKGTLSTRKRSYRQLRELFALRSDVLLFRALRDLWWHDADARQLLAVLCATARDPLLRATADWIASVPVGEEVTTGQLSALVEQTFPGRYKPTVQAVTARNLIASWRQSGHVSPAPKRERIPAVNRPTATAYALLLGHLCGARGDLLFETIWARLLDQPEHLIREQTTTASHQGWLEYRHAGGVTEITFRQLLRDEGEMTLA